MKVPGLSHDVVADLGGGRYAQVFAAEGASGRVVIKMAREAPRDLEAQVMAAEGVHFLTGDIAASDPDPNDVLRAEARVLSRIRHPDFVRLLDQGEVVVDGRVRTYLELEYVDGVPLRALVGRRGPSGLQLFAQAVDALAEAAAAGELTWHGDVKPDNVMVTFGGGIKLIDPSSGMAQVDGAGGPVSLLRTRCYSGRTDVTDCPAVGMTLLELLLGEHPLVAAGRPPRSPRSISPPFPRWDTPFESLATMPLPREVWPDVPRAVEETALLGLGLQLVGDGFEVHWPPPTLPVLHAGLRAAVPR